MEILKLRDCNLCDNTGYKSVCDIELEGQYCNCEWGQISSHYLASLKEGAEDDLNKRSSIRSIS
jgi:ribosomal protein L14